MFAERERSHVCRGFTLVEVLAGLVISGFIVALLFSASAATGKRWSAGRTFADHSAQRSAAIEFLRREIAQLVPMRLRERKELRILFYGDERRLGFIAPLPYHRAAGGLFTVSFRIEHRQGRQVVVLYHRRLGSYHPTLFELDDTWQEKVLLDDLAYAEFRYAEHSEAAAGKSETWHGEWSDETALPSRVGLSLAFADAPADVIELGFPVRARALVRRIALEMRASTEVPTPEDTTVGAAAATSILAW